MSEIFEKQATKALYDIRAMDSWGDICNNIHGHPLQVHGKDSIIPLVVSALW